MLTGKKSKDISKKISVKWINEEEWKNYKIEIWGKKESKKTIRERK